MQADIRGQAEVMQEDLKRDINESNKKSDDLKTEMKTMKVDVAELKTELKENIGELSNQV